MPKVNVKQEKKAFTYKYDELINPVFQAIQQLGGSGNNSEIEEKIISILNLSDREVEDIHRGNTTKLSYRTAWAKNYLKKFGVIENSARGIWTLTDKGKKTIAVNNSEVKKFVQNTNKNSKLLSTHNQNLDEDSIDELVDLTWHEELIEVLKTIEPSSFERLSQRLLRELGFVNVEVTGKSGDGGIDGVGVIKISGILSFHVVFQCKRYANPVSSSAIRDFRGAMIGRADKGIFITTSTFTRDAKAEAQRDGAPPIDIIDGNELAKKLKELKLGVSVEIVEKVTINKKWFENI